MRRRPASTIVRQAKGSDNWPLTWGDDDALYAAYGDGNGFEPRTKEKLSLGLARITGEPDGFRAENERLQAEREGAFREFVADVNTGEYPQPEHLVPVADDVTADFVAYLDSVS